MTVLRQELFSLRRQSRSYLRQLCFWAETVAKLGGELNRVRGELNRVPIESESKLRDKLVACGDWPPHMATTVDAGFQELGYHFSDMYRAMLHQLSSH